MVYSSIAQMKKITHCWLIKKNHRRERKREREFISEKQKTNSKPSGKEKMEDNNTLFEWKDTMIEPKD
jgi:hypothetical protein